MPSPPATLVHDPLNRIALRCFRALVASVGAEIIVDFVEHDLGRGALPALGFGLAQDYLLHRPEPVARLAADGSATVPCSFTRPCDR